MLHKVISGGQTGADEAGIRTAKLYGLATGGWMPPGWITTAGPKPQYEELYGLKEHIECGYKPRTFANVRDSDATVRFACKFDSPGEICTFNAIKYYGKPFFDVHIDTEQEFETIKFIRWLNDNHIVTLNVAGNSERSCRFAFDFTCRYLSLAFEQIGLTKCN